jgi:hypothetical protein
VRISLALNVPFNFIYFSFNKLVVFSDKDKEAEFTRDESSGSSHTENKTEVNDKSHDSSKDHKEIEIQATDEALDSSTNDENNPDADVKDESLHSSCDKNKVETETRESDDTGRLPTIHDSSIF